MRIVFILVVMLFLHSFVDFHLQGVLASLKQKNTWLQNGTDPHGLYRNDYKIALAMHSFEWSFVVMLPCLPGIYRTCLDFSWPHIRIGMIYILLLLLNSCLHYLIDDLKANEFAINLVTDQICHIIQVVMTWAIWTFMIGW